MSEEKYAWEDPYVSDEERLKKKKEKVLELTEKEMKRKNIAKEMRISESQVWLLRKQLIKEGKLEVSSKNRVFKARPEKQIKKYEDILKTQFAQIPCIKNMIERLQKTRDDYQNVVGYIYKVCKTIEVHPEKFLEEEGEVEKLKELFIDKFSKGEAFYIDTDHHKRFVNAEDTSPANYIQSIKALRRTNNKPTSVGFLQYYHHVTGRYAKVKLSDTQRLQGIEYMTKKSELLRNVFILGHEIGPRINTLLNMKANFERHSLDVDGMPCEFFTTTVFEKKQEDAQSGGGR